MPRKPYYRKALRAFYILHNGRSVRLGRTKQEAYAAWRKLLADHAEAPPDVRVSELASRFLTWTEENRAPATLVFYRQFLDRFTALYGDRQASTRRPNHVTEWPRMHGYHGTTGSCAVRSVMRMFNWCDKQGNHEPPRRRIRRRPIGTDQTAIPMEVRPMACFSEVVEEVRGTLCGMTQEEVDQLSDETRVLSMGSIPVLCPKLSKLLAQFAWLGAHTVRTVMREEAAAAE